MAKNSLLDYSTTPSSNTDIAGISIVGTAPVNNFDDAFRTIMSQMKNDLDYKEVYISKSANYTAVVNDNNARIRFTSNATLSLTAAATLGANWHLRVSAPASVTVTVDPNGAELINGAATVTLQPGYIADIWCDGTAFFANIAADPTIVDYSTMFAAKGSYSSKSANYTVVASDINDTIRFTASATASLTAAATLGANFNTTIWADYGASVTIDPDSAELINGNATLILQPGQRAEIWCTGTAFVAKVTSDALSGPQLQGYSFGLALTSNAGDAANDVDIAAGAAGSDASPFYLMQLASALTKRIDASWTAGTSQGGLDTGSVSASGTYYIWLIQRSDTLVTDALFSLSSTSPTLPSGYDRKRLIGSLARTSSSNSLPTSALVPDTDVKAWVNFNGTGVVATRASKNVTSITDNGTGDYTVNFATPLPSGNYVVAGMGAPPAPGGGRGYIELHSTAAKTSTSCRITTGSVTGAVGAGDLPEVDVIFIGG